MYILRNNTLWIHAVVAWVATLPLLNVLPGETLSRVDLRLHDRATAPLRDMLHPKKMPDLMNQNRWLMVGVAALKALAFHVNSFQAIVRDRQRTAVVGIVFLLPLPNGKVSFASVANLRKADAEQLVIPIKICGDRDVAKDGFKIKSVRACFCGRVAPALPILVFRADRLPVGTARKFAPAPKGDFVAFRQPRRNHGLRHLHNLTGHDAGTAMPWVSLNTHDVPQSMTYSRGKLLKIFLDTSETRSVHKDRAHVGPLLIIQLPALNGLTASACHEHQAEVRFVSRGGLLNGQSRLFPVAVQSVEQKSFAHIALMKPNMDRYRCLRRIRDSIARGGCLGLQLFVLSAASATKNSYQAEQTRKTHFFLLVSFELRRAGFLPKIRRFSTISLKVI